LYRIVKLPMGHTYGVLRKLYYLYG